MRHTIRTGSSKKVLTQQLRDQGYLPKGIFSQKDIDKVLADEYVTMAISDKEIEYLKEHISDWENGK